MNTNTHLVDIVGGEGVFFKVKGGAKKFGEENRHFESWRGEKSTPRPEYIPLQFLPYPGMHLYVWSSSDIIL